MRNKFGDECYECGLWVAPGTGHFERVRGQGWRVKHALHAGRGAVTCKMAARTAVTEEINRNRDETSRFGCVG